LLSVCWNFELEVVTKASSFNLWAWNFELEVVTKASSFNLWACEHFTIHDALVRSSLKFAFNLLNLEYGGRAAYHSTFCRYWLTSQDWARATRLISFSIHNWFLKDAPRVTNDRMSDKKAKDFHHWHSDSCRLQRSVDLMTCFFPRSVGMVTCSFTLVLIILAMNFCLTLVNCLYVLPSLTIRIFNKLLSKID